MHLHSFADSLCCQSLILLLGSCLLFFIYYDKIVYLNLLFAKAGEYIASGSDDGRWFIWEKRTGRLVKMLHGDDAGKI